MGNIEELILQKATTPRVAECALLVFNYAKKVGELASYFLMSDIRSISKPKQYQSEECNEAMSMLVEFGVFEMHYEYRDDVITEEDYLACIEEKCDPITGYYSENWQEEAGRFYSCKLKKQTQE